MPIAGTFRVSVSCYFYEIKIAHNFWALGRTGSSAAKLDYERLLLRVHGGKSTLFFIELPRKS